MITALRYLKSVMEEGLIGVGMDSWKEVALITWCGIYNRAWSPWVGPGKSTVQCPHVRVQSLLLLLSVFHLEELISEVLGVLILWWRRNPAEVQPSCVLIIWWVQKLLWCTTILWPCQVSKITVGGACPPEWGDDGETCWRCDRDLVREGE